MATQQTWLNLVWFGLLGVLLIGYAILDGFDLGVGILHLLVARTDTDRRILMNSIGPLWDGNEVWLVTFGGALFAAFPEAYATAFSGFYLPFMLLLFALIFRGVSMEFRSKQPGLRWRRAWDIAFCAASAGATLLFGIAVGTIMAGMHLTARFEYAGTLLDLIGIHAADSPLHGAIPLGGGLRFDPFPLLVGLLAVATFAMHGAIYLYLKTGGELQQRIQRIIWRCFYAFLACYLLTTAVAWFAHPHVARNFFTPGPLAVLAWLIAGLNLLAVANIPRALHQGRPLYAFITSACTIAALVFLFGVALFPHMIISITDPAVFGDAATVAATSAGVSVQPGLDVANAASSQSTLGLMLVIAVIGMPFVVAYTAIIYWTFRGKVEIGKFSY
ncbi:MAG: cytochrome d ubiquinol oxidase subunit II [Planctomycetota bacterium]